MDLRQVDIDNLGSMNTSQGALVDNREVQLNGERTINTALVSASIDQRFYVRDAWSGRGVLVWSVVRIKAEISAEDYPVSDKALTACLGIVKPAINLRHSVDDTSPMLAG